MQRTGHRTTPRAKHPHRHGAAAVEFAFVVAIGFVFLLTTFEFCRVAVMEHSVNNAVYEGVRSATVPGGNAASVARASRGVLSAIGIDDARITVTPSHITQNTERVTVDIQVPLDANSFVPTNFFRGKVIERSLTMRREGTR